MPGCSPSLPPGGTCGAACPPLGSATPPSASAGPDPVQHTAQAADSIREDFLLIAEDGYLNLYRRGEGSALILSERLDLALFPQNDALQLTRGITFDGEEAAFSAFEDYIG